MDGETITALHGEALSNGAIARWLGVSKHTVALWIKCHDDTGQTLHQLGAGRPRCTMPAQDRAIAAIILNRHFTTAPSTRKELGLACTPQKIRNRHHSHDLHAHIPTKKTHLTEVDMERHLKYELEYAEKPTCFWEDVVYCDEKTFSTDERTTTRVWRRRNER
ncbi:putative Transposable element Tc1 transposase-like 50 [Homarus americanus]|uniref:Putative Transposable element Tc1 transposase-like 50 n=1 Tax=Homarus americanus TaxID=6706 RepID=A0A8J5THE7_HOMAM|nr:putative Transposable element Tc1 transposase-like 50 [Homarus americanus]